MTTRPELRGGHLHFDPLSGIAGDMTVAALVDAGVPAEVVRDAIAAMNVAGLAVSFERRVRGAYAGMAFVVTWPGMPERRPPPARGHQHAHPHDPHHHDPHPHGHAAPSSERGAGGQRAPLPGAAPVAYRPVGREEGPSASGPLVSRRGGEAHGHDHRDYAAIRRLLAAASFDQATKELAGKMFARIAEVEAALHGTSVDHVTFHEVGAYDSIADVVGVAAAISWLAPRSVTSSPPVVGTGTVRTAHGPVAVPAPATAALLRDVPVRMEGTGELTTPTGAAVLATIVDSFGAAPPLRLVAQGFGAGTRELTDRANVLRVLLGSPLGPAQAIPADTVVLVEANVDDMSPQLVEPLLAALFAAGAVDAWTTPIVMKKGRPAFQISALAPAEARDAIAAAFFRNSTTIGVRHAVLGRTTLARTIRQVETSFGTVDVKVSALGDEVLGATPEFDDCRRLADEAHVPVREVLREAVAAAARLAPPHKSGG